MKRFISIICLFSFLGLCLPTYANYKTITVPANTSIYISPIDTATSKDKNLADINCQIVNDVVVDGVKIFKSGAKAEIHVGEIQKARCWGNPGKMLISNGFAYDVNGEKQKILITKNCFGEEKTWPKVCGGISIFFLWPLALFGFVHGGQATISATTELETYLASQYSFKLRN